MRAPSGISGSAALSEHFATSFARTDVGGRDEAGGRDLDTWHNRPYYNLGCSYQTMMAAQVADPIDLVRPRGEGPSDSVKRTKDIEALRKDQDPSTNWRKDDVKIKEAQQ